MLEDDDPFVQVQRDVMVSVRECSKLLQQWEAQKKKDPTAQVPLDVIEEKLGNIETDLQDLEDTVVAAESDPTRFCLTPADLEERKAFVHGALSECSSLSKKLREHEQQALDKDHADKAKGGDITPDVLLHAGLQRQQEIMSKQDRELGKLSTALGRQKEAAAVINTELTAQNTQLDKLSLKVDEVRDRLKRVSKKMDLIIDETSNEKKASLIILLSIVLVVLIVLTFMG